MQNSSWRLGYILVLCPVKGTRLDAWFSPTTAKALRHAGIALPDDHMQRNLAPWPYLAFQVSTICLAGGGQIGSAITGITGSSFRGSAKVFSYVAGGCGNAPSRSNYISSKHLTTSYLRTDTEAQVAWSEAC